MASFTWNSADLVAIVDKIIANPESEVFREPVPWKELGLVDYLDVVKHPSDLGTVRTKLVENRYLTLEHAVVDIRQIWKNATVYNAVDSSVYVVAQQISVDFEHFYTTLCAGSDGKGKLPPSAMEAAAWVDKCHRLTPGQLGEVLEVLKKHSPYCLARSRGGQVDIDVDLLTGEAYHTSHELMHLWVNEVQPDRDLFRLSAKRKSSVGVNQSAAGGGGGGVNVSTPCTPTALAVTDATEVMDVVETKSESESYELKTGSSSSAEATGTVL